jgi:hypothetical protein
MVSTMEWQLLVIYSAIGRWYFDGRYIERSTNLHSMSRNLNSYRSHRNWWWIYNVIHGKSWYHQWICDAASPPSIHYLGDRFQQLTWSLMCGDVWWRCDDMVYHHFLTMIQPYNNIIKAARFGKQSSCRTITPRPLPTRPWPYQIMGKWRAKNWFVMFDISIGHHYIAENYIKIEGDWWRNETPIINLSYDHPYVPTHQPIPWLDTHEWYGILKW